MHKLLQRLEKIAQSLECHAKRAWNRRRRQCQDIDLRTQRLQGFFQSIHDLSAHSKRSFKLI